MLIFLRSFINPRKKIDNRDSPMAFERIQRTVSIPNLLANLRLIQGRQAGATLMPVKLAA
jgi:hypothetical protein